MQTIYKYALPQTVSATKVQLYEDARILDVQMQDDALVFWALIEDTKPPKDFMFLVAGTGIELPLDMSEWRYVGTAQDGYYVWHLFYSDWDKCSD